MSAPYPHLEKFAREIGVEPQNLLKRWELARKFHTEILEETSPDQREALYARFYEEAEPLFRSCWEQQGNPKLGHVQAFRRELTGKSVLDLGCGPGDFLKAIAQMLPHGDLVGLDAVPPPDAPPVRFLRSSIINFNVDQQFDVVFSDNVMEHLAPADVPMHLQSVHRALKPGGKFIVIMPNRLFGPQDCTRVLDDSYTGAVEAQGCHLNESTNSEMTDIMSRYGFGPFQSVPHLALGKRLPIRVDTRWMRMWEEHPWLLGLARTIRRHGRPIFKVPIILIATRGEAAVAAQPAVNRAA